jgi:hypothetical protein
MMKLAIIWFLVLINSSVFSGELPVKPVGCYDNSNFCSTIEVKKINGVKVLDLEVFALIERRHFPDIKSIIDRFIDFHQWPQYVAGSENIKFDISESLFTAGNDYSHRFDYTIKAPWPVRKSRVRGVAHFNEATSSFSGSLISYKFDLDKTKPFGGVSEYYGSIHVYNETSDFFEVSYKSIVSPSITTGLDLAKPYVRKPIEEILRGMYE